MNYGLHNVIAESLAPKGREVIYKQRLLIVLFTRAMFTSTVKYCFQFNTFVLEGSSFTLSLSTVTDAGPITAVLQCCQLVHCCQTLPAKWTMLDIDPSTTSTSSIRIRSKFVLSHFIMNVVKAHEFFFVYFIGTIFHSHTFLKLTSGGWQKSRFMGCSRPSSLTRTTGRSSFLIRVFGLPLRDGPCNTSWHGRVSYSFWDSTYLWKSFKCFIS